MSYVKVGDIVARISYGQDVFFKVVDIKDPEGDRTVFLKGITYRIEADAPESDLVIQPKNTVEEYNRKCFRTDDNENEDIIMSGVGVKSNSEFGIKKLYR